MGRKHQIPFDYQPRTEPRKTTWKLPTAAAEGARTVAENPRLIGLAGQTLLVYGSIAALASAPATGLSFAIFGKMAHLSVAHQFVAWTVTGLIFLPICLMFFVTPLALGYARLSAAVLEAVRDRQHGIGHAERRHARKVAATDDAEWTPALEDTLTAAVFPILPIAIAAFGWQLIVMVGNLYATEPQIASAGWVLLAAYAGLWRPLRSLFWAFVMRDEPSRIGVEIEHRSDALTTGCRGRLFALLAGFATAAAVCGGAWLAIITGILPTAPAPDLSISTGDAATVGWAWWLLAIIGGVVILLVLGTIAIAALAWAYTNETNRGNPPKTRPNRGAEPDIEPHGDPNDGNDTDRFRRERRMPGEADPGEEY